MIFNVSFIISLISQYENVASYEYLTIFVLMLLESIIFPIPSEIVLPFTGFLIALGKINPFIGTTDAIAASVIGSIIGYYLGLFLGIDVFLKYSRKVGFKDETYYAGIDWIKKYGVYFAFISKLLPAVRSVASIICGAFKMSFRKFVLYSTIGIIIWSTVLVYIGFSLSSKWISAGYDISSITPYIILIGAIIVLYLLRKPIIDTLKRMRRI
ncbi:MAG: DedA family protein [Candidatus Acidifodinimicrobium sp.]